MSNYLTRRDFIQFSATAAALLGFAGCATFAKQPRKPRPIAPGAKIRFAQIGCGGKGFSDTMAHKDEEVVAICDIDWTRPQVKKLFEEFPNAKRYRDFRKMLVEMDDQIDAVGVATPDHMHFLPAYMAIMLGKHVYVQKPLTQTVGEARELLRLARLNGVCTQMGNQGHAGEGIRLVREWFEAGVLGEVREVNIWTNRPATAARTVWPQGIEQWPPSDTPPEGFSQDLFLGRAPERPYSSAIHPFKWRGYRDYGCGALGDMACHLMDAAFWGLQLGAPASVELTKIEGLTNISFPKSAIVTYQFPARGNLAPVKLVWHEGGEKPAKPAQMEETRQLAQGGQLIIGSKGTVYDGNDYCNSPRFLPESFHKELAESGKLPPKTIPRPDPIGNPHKEWTRAIRANNPSAAGSNFEYSCPFTEMVSLGTMSIIVGKKFTWDPVAMKTSLPEADKLLYPTYRRGWSPKQIV
ncbi:MAG: Gfo/Idh/MocA family oxidoreductase [Opitutaceae bacterium]|nr:Gfo/Idh/MocA family oxidoreductase [Opitutaceae bacterium]